MDMADTFQSCPSFTKWKILNLCAWSTLLSNKLAKYTIFFLYSWCIYQSYFIIIIPFLILDEVKSGYFTFGYLGELLGLLFFFIPFAITIVEKFINDFQWINLVYLAAGCFVLWAYLLFVYFWWDKQTILRAWLLATIGMFAGPGLALIFSVPGDGDSDSKGIIAIIGINIFYFLLYKLNNYQKKHDPDNKFANRIRYILKWPCLRT